jgi:hypothetical protein
MTTLSGGQSARNEGFMGLNSAGAQLQGDCIFMNPEAVAAFMHGNPTRLIKP